jgi:ABC-type lipoprotein release transport system permease subunit
MGRSNAGVWYWARRELAQRWRSLVVLGVLGGVAGGVGIAAVAGARRTDTAYERWRVATAAPDAIVFGTQVGLFDADYAPVLQLPEVVDAGAFSLSPIGLDGKIGSLPPGDPVLYQRLAKPLLRHGRLPSRSRPDEVVVNRKAASQYGLHVGSEVAIWSSTDADDFFAGGRLDGPRQRARVVGIGDSPIDSVFTADEASFFPSFAFFERHPDVPIVPNLVVRLRPGTDVNEFHERVTAAMGLPDVPVRDLGEDAKRFQNSTDLERTGLLLFAVVTLIAGLVIVGQAIARVVYAIAENARALRALGFTRLQLVTGLVLPLIVAAAVTAAVTIGLAVALSPWFPIGFAARLEPDPGVHVDVLVLVPAAILFAVATVMIALTAALRATSLRAVSVDSESQLIRRVRAVAPLPVSIGAGLALERGRGERALPVRPAIAGAVAAVVGVVGALGLLSGIDDAVAVPERSGQVWDAEVYATADTSLDDVASAARRDPRLTGVVRVVRIPLTVEGAGVPVYALRQVKGATAFALISGRAPVTPDEVALGPSTAKALGAGIGDRVRIGTDPTRRSRVVGVALLPQTAHSSFDQGAWVPPRALAPHLDTLPPEAVLGSVTIAVVVRDGLDRDKALASLPDQLGSDDVEPTTLPQDVINLRNVRSLPRMLALFLAFLGVAAVGHVLVTAVRRRRHDLAILRAIGFRPIQAAACIGWQATTVGIIGLVIGVPLGIVAGRLAWRWVADNTPLLYVGPVAIAAVLLIVPATLLIANVLAALPARRAARIRPATVLRTE